MLPLNANSLSERKGDLRSRKIARFGLVISLSLGLTIAFQENSSAASNPKELKVNTLKQITFHKMDYNFEQFYCLDEIVYKESRWNPKAKNPKSSAYGLFQILKSKEKDPIKQIDLGLKYLDRRYDGCACKALAHHKAKGWY
jgi:soluble lytic murein transglycosylase-like protein